MTKALILHYLKRSTILVVLTVCSAQAAQVLRLAEALELADNSHPLLQAGIAQIDVARAGIVTSKAYPNPQASVSVGHQSVRVAGNVTGLVSVYGVSQPLELGALRPSRIQYAERYRESTDAALALTRLSVLAAVRRTFFQVLRRRGELDIAGENLRLVEDLRNRTQVRVDVGEAGRLELVRAEAEVATARSLANSTQLRLVTEVSQLRAAVGTPLDADLTLQGTLDRAVVLPPLEELRTETLERHPAIALVQSEVRRAESRVAYERALARPQPALRSDVDRYPDVPNFRFGIEIPLPFWNKREGPIAEAVAAQRQASSAAQARQIELLAALEGAYGRYQVAAQQLAAFEQGLLQEAEEALRAAETAFQLGERGILEVLDAQRILRIVRLDFLNAQFDRQAALIDLDELRAVDLRRQTP
jgi:cobalt-zinc-cadmium efflux system outer membrane protein